MAVRPGENAEEETWTDGDSEAPGETYAEPRKVEIAGPGCSIDWRIGRPPPGPVPNQAKPWNTKEWKQCRQRPCVLNWTQIAIIVYTLQGVNGKCPAMRSGVGTVRRNAH